MKLERALRRLGWPGLLGLMLLGAGSWTTWRAAPEVQEEARQLASDARRLRHELIHGTTPDGRSAGPSGVGGATLVQQQEAWARLWSGLKASDDRIALQDAVLRTAREEGVVTSTVQYRGQREGWVGSNPDVGLWRQRMVVPVEASYPSLRRWIGHMLEEPSLSIDVLDIERPDLQSDRVKAQVTVSLWWRQTGGH
ncbi:MAG: hypothetical protein QM742_15640 [Aquabacterium sp.]